MIKKIDPEKGGKEGRGLDWIGFWRLVLLLRGGVGA